MTQVTEKVPAQAPLLIVSFREQFLLQGGPTHGPFLLRDEGRRAS